MKKNDRGRFLLDLNRKLKPSKWTVLIFWSGLDGGLRTEIMKIGRAIEEMKKYLNIEKS